MTRINCVHPAMLTGKHLIAEYRELPRIFTLATKAYERGESPTDKRNPIKYVLDTGHVRFFYNKLGYLRKRHNLLVKECDIRGYLTTIDCSHSSLNLPKEWQGNWDPTKEAVKLNISRLKERDPNYYKFNC